MSQRENIDNTIPFEKVQSETTEELSLLDKYDRLGMKYFADTLRQDRWKDFFEPFQLRLNKAVMPIGYEQYISRILLTAVILSIVVLFISFTTAGILLFDFIIGIGIDLPLIEILPGGLPGINLNFVGVTEFQFFLLGFILWIIFSVPFVLLPCLAMYMVPWYRASERKREINTMLPYVITFMYALSRGGANLVDVMTTVSESEDAYGEVTIDFQVIVRNIEYFDSDLRDALVRAGRQSPSPEFEAFTDDLISIIDTGGDISEFLYQQTQEYLDIARQRQEEFLSRLSLIAEVYVTIMVAGPLFAIIMITVITLVGGGSEVLLMGLVYFALPIGNLFFYFIIDFVQIGKSTDSTIKDYQSDVSYETLSDLFDTDSDSRIKSVLKKRKRSERLEKINNPKETLRDHPVYTLLLSIPGVILYGVLAGVVVVQTGIIDMSQHIILSIIFGVIPLIIVFTPLSVFTEMKLRRRKQINNQLPQMMRKLSSANATGMKLVDSFEVVSESSRGELGKELRYMKNDIEWLDNVNAALARFARRIDIPRASRTVKLITKANRATGNITDVLDVSAKSLTNNQRLDKERKSEMSLYTAVILISFLVFLGVVVMIDSYFLERIAELTQKAGDVPDSAGFGVGDVPVKLYELVLFHSTIVQAISSGIIAGHMGSEKPLTGLKFVIVMIILSSLVFIFI